MMERALESKAQPGPSFAEPAVTAATAGIDHVSSVVWCRKRCREAVVSAIRRESGGAVFQYVQWCSLIGFDVACDEHCIALPAGEDRHSR
jgi:hypothetical protein